MTKTVDTPVNMPGSSTARAGAWEWHLGADRWTLSRGLRQICGMGEDEETSPARLRTIVHPEDLPYVRRTVAAAFARLQPIDFHLRIIRGGDGAVRRIRLAGDCVSDDHGLATRAWGSARDVTDSAGAAEDLAEREVAEALRASEERYRLLAENMQDVVWLMDLTANEFTYVSPSVQRLRGYTAEEVMAMPAVEALTPASQQIIAAEIEKSLPSFLAGVPHNPPALELEQPRKDGTTVWTEAIGRLVRSEQTGHIEVYGLSRDLSERKAKEEEIRRLNNELEQRVVERTAQLEAALAELRQNEALKDAFLASISHELRTPLTGILALADALEMQTAGPLNQRQQRFLARIRDSGDRLLKMVTSILEYTALIAGRTQFRTETCMLIELGGICLRDVRAAAVAKQLSMHLEVNPANLEIASDPVGIRKLLGYLLDNAVKFTPPGGSAGVEIAADGAQEAVVLAVWDTGIGIDPAKRDAIFRPFEQVDSGLNRQYEGAGLGLACVYQLVKGLGGSIAVESMLGAGSRFSVTLPLVRRDLVPLLGSA